ncbi:MAG: metal ABC transporter permease [Patescibacteria group bacterium]|nr:metal ABC transporter permease [Patescibacteria group bacterium]
MFPQLDANTVMDLWIVAVGATTNVACALVGCYLVLRRMSMLGDAISHAVLPGLVVAFVLSGSLGPGFMFLGALAAGVLTAVLTETLHRYGGVSEDASMGVVFTAMFAVGVILIRRYAHAVDLDADCVFSGSLDMVTFHQVSVLGVQMPRALLSIGPVAVLNFVFIAMLWKEMLLSSFDPGLATTMGFRAGVLRYALMVLVALTAVASFEQVGSILVVAMLIVPGATAHLLTDRLRNMLWIAAGVAVGGLYLLAVLFSPRYGVLAAMATHARTTLRIVREDVLGMLYRLEELDAPRPMPLHEAARAVGGGMAPWFAVCGLLLRGEVARAGLALHLTSAGRSRAQRIVRSHRLWEAYLVQYLNLPPDHVHEPAMRMEHFISAPLARELASDIASDETDPHGRDIPPAQP